MIEEKRKIYRGEVLLAKIEAEKETKKKLPVPRYIFYYQRQPLPRRKFPLSTYYREPHLRRELLTMAPVVTLLDVLSSSLRLYPGQVLGGYTAAFIRNHDLLGCLTA